MIISSILYELYVSYDNDDFAYIQFYAKKLIGWQAYRGDQIHQKNSPT